MPCAREMRKRLSDLEWVIGGAKLRAYSLRHDTQTFIRFAPGLDHGRLCDGSNKGGVGAAVGRCVSKGRDNHPAAWRDPDISSGASGRRRRLGRGRHNKGRRGRPGRDARRDDHCARQRVARRSDF